MGWCLRLFLALLVSAFLGSAFELITPGNYSLSTYTSNIQYESIQFPKRAKNDSVQPVLEFKVIDVPSKDIKISLKYNGESLDVGNPGDHSDVYAVKKYDSNGLLTTISLHLKDSAANSGVYLLTLTSGGKTASAEAKILSAPILPIYSKPKRVLQGDPLRISCRVSGYPTPISVQWLFAPISVDLSDDKAAISSASENLRPIDLTDEMWKNANFSTDAAPDDTLRFDAISVAQNGLFACNASNSLGSDSTFLLVGVKDRWAALWPFIGIVVEVTVLVAAILLYERHQIRKKPAAPEPSTNPDATSPNGNAVDKNSKPDEVRLRNARA